MLVLGLAMAVLCTMAGFAQAASQASLKGVRGKGYERILVVWPETQTTPELSLDAHISNGVLVARFSQPLDADPKVLLADLAGEVALARLDADHRTLRVALRAERTAQVSQSYNVFAIDLVPPGSTVKPPKIVSPRALRERQQEIARKQQAEAMAAARRKAARPGPALPLRVRAAQTSDYTRIAFDWTQPVGHSISQKGNTATLVFDRPAIPDLSDINANMPRDLIAASSTVDGAKTRIKLDMAPGIQARLWNDGNRVMVDLFKPKQDQPPAPKKAVKTDAAKGSHDVQKAAAGPHRPEHANGMASVEVQNAAAGPEPAVTPLTEPEPAPVVPAPALPPADPSPDGVIHVKVSHAGTDLQLIFDFAAPVGSAAFRRADTMWIVFDDDAVLDMSELEHGARRDISSFAAFRDDAATGVRFKVLPSTQIEARVGKSGAQWVYSFGEKLTTPPGKLALHRESDGSGPGKLVADLANVTAVHRLSDPAIGDRITVATALGPVSGVQSRRYFVDVNVLSSAQGLAIEVNADDIQIVAKKDQVEVVSRTGLALTPSAHPTHIALANRALSSAAIPARSATPGFIDFKTWATPDPKLDFNANYDLQLRRVAAEATDPQRRIELARFLVANGLGAEALGMLSLAQRLDPLLVKDAQFRAVRGTANLLMHRIRQARADFAAQTLNRDPAAALWRGYLAAQMQDWGTARREFDAGREAFYLFEPHWQSRFRTAYARSALALNDLGAAKTQIDEALAVDADQDTRLHTRLLQAQYAEVSGDHKKAIRLYQNVAEAGYEPLETKAIFEKTRIELETGAISPAAAADIIENLRFRWRGDNTELEEVRTLGKIYSDLHDYRRALEAMNTAVLRFPQSPVTRGISADMRKIFNTLFLQGGADSMDPVQALALFYEFIDLVPIGADGDRMLRRLAGRLVDFDLLPQASELLQHQIDKRIRNGRARAQIAAKLALIYLMDHKPEKALMAIRSTRLSGLPKDLMHERRMIEARAFIALGRPEQAQDLLETDRTHEGALLRANIAWKSRDWETAAPVMLKIVQRYVSQSGALDETDASLVLRTAIALSLADDQNGVEMLKQNFAKAMAGTRDNEAFAMVASHQNLSSIPVEKLAPELAETDNLRAVLDRYTEHFETPAPDSAASQDAPLAAASDAS